MGVVKEVVKEGAVDREVYVRVREYRLYRVIVKDKATGKVIKEDVRYPVEKVVERRGRSYKYYYIRVLVPWASRISRAVGRRDRYELVVEVH